MSNKFSTLRLLLALATMGLGSVFAQTGYFQNFNTGSIVPTAITSGAPYVKSIDNQTLKVIVNKGDLFSGMNITFPTPLNLSVAANRKVSFKIRTDTATRNRPYELTIFAFSGTVQLGGITTSKFVYPTSKWQTVSFDFNSTILSGFASFPFSNVTSVQILVQQQTYMSGTIFIDDFTVGNNGINAPIVSPYFMGFPNQDVYINTPSKFKILYAMDADLFRSNVNFTAVSSDPTILPNPTFDTPVVQSNRPYTFQSGNGSTGSLLTNVPVFMNLNPVSSAHGIVNVTVTATAPSNVAGIVSTPHSFVISVNVKRNVAPTIGVIPTSLAIGSNVKTALRFDDIFNQNGEITQNMTITGTSSDEAVIPNSQIVVSFNGIGVAGTAHITPTAFNTLAVKTCNVTFSIRDNGGVVAGGLDQTNYVIPVTVYSTYFNSPTMDVIPNQVDNIQNQGLRIITITGITDGNRASRIDNIVATSGDGTVIGDPTVIYSVGQNFALLSYNAVAIGTTTISVTATNFGAPNGSNGNSSFTRVFNFATLKAPLSGYIEPFTVATTVGPPQNGVNSGDGRFSTVNGVWYVENKNIQRVTINTTTGVLTNVMDKPGTAGEGYFSGMWYKPDGGELFDFKAFPYLSVTLSTTNTTGRVAIDLWDVNGIRYGLSANQAVTGTPTTYTFCYTGEPSPGFDFSKIKLVLFNLGVTLMNTGQGNWPVYVGTYTLSNLRLGNQAQGSGSCAAPLSRVILGTLPNPFHLASDAGLKSVTMSGFSAGFTFVNGINTNPINLNVAGALNPTVSIIPGTDLAKIEYTTSNASGAFVISVTGTAVGSTPTTSAFTVNVQNLPADPRNVVVQNSLTAPMPDGRLGQTIDGSPFGVCEMGPSDIKPQSYYDMLKETNVQSMRIGIFDFEPVNDNSNSNVLDKTKLDYTAMCVDFFKRAHDAGVERFLVTFFSPPNFTKINREIGVPVFGQNSPGFVVSNTIDSAYYKEYAEYALAFVQGIKEKTGVDIYGISMGNEIQFNQSYPSVVLTTTQYVEIIRAVGRRFKAEGIKTFLWGAETLQGQDSGNNYMKACQTDTEVREYFAGYAVHSYAADGVGAGGPNPGNWIQILADSRDVRSNVAMSNVRSSLIATVGPDREVHNGNGGTGIPVHQTETSQGTLTTYRDWNNALGIFQGVISSVNIGNVSGWYYIGIEREAKMFYTYKHINKFVFGGARRVPMSVPGVNINGSAFRNPDGSLAVLLATGDGTMQTISLSGTNMPTAFKAYLSVDNLFWKDLGTVSGSVVMPPNAMLTLWGDGTALLAANGITVTGEMGMSNIENPGGILQMSANVQPLNLVDKSVTWSIISTTGTASITQLGLLSGLTNGLITVRATANTTPSVFGDLVVTISGQISVPITNLAITTIGINTNEINTQLGEIQFGPVFFPTTTTQKSVKWTIQGNQTSATISSGGLLRATNSGNGVITVTATSLSNTSITSSVVVTISGQISSVSLSPPFSLINTDGGIATITAQILPSNALTGLRWTLSNTATATINVGTNTAIINAVDNGVVTITAFIGGISTITSSVLVSITGQKVKSVSLTASNTAISTPNGSVQLTPSFLPINAEGKKVIYTVFPSNLVFVSNTGLVVGANNGNREAGVVVTATVEGSAVSTTFTIPLSGQNSVGFNVITSTSATTTLDTRPELFIYRVKAGSTNLVGVNTLGGVSSMDGGSGQAVIITMLKSDTTQKIERTINVSGSSTSMELFVRSSVGGDVVSSNLNIGDEVIIQPLLIPTALNFVSSEYSWTFSSQGIVSVDVFGVIKGLTNGVVTVTVTYLKNPTITKTEVITVGPLSITDFQNSDRYFSISPNPTTGLVKVESNSTNGLVVSVYNVSGALVLSAKTKESNVTINLGNNPLGLYNIVVIGSNGVYSKKLVVE